MVPPSLTQLNVVQLLKSLSIPILLGSVFWITTWSVQSQTFLTEYKKKLASDAASDDEFGVDVAVAGDWAVVGAQADRDVSQVYDIGSAYVFYRHWGGQNQWGEVTKLSTVQPGTGNRFFGASVAISGDTIVVGAYQPDRSTPGAAFVFERNQGGPDRWGQTKMLVPSNGLNGDQFGFSVAIDGNTIVVGANKADATFMIANSGKAYVFERDAGGPGQWGEVAILSEAQAFENDLFGESVTIHGDTIVVGVPGDDDFNSNGGSVCVYDRDSNDPNAWVFVKKFSSSPVFASDQFGNAVSLFEDTLVVGASLADVLVGNEGSAYVYERNQGGANQWGSVRRLMANPAGSDQFGSDVSIYEDEIVVGASNALDVEDRVGLMYRFKRNQGGANQWGLVTTLRASDAASGDKFGESVSLQGDMIFGGASWNDDHGNRSGSAYVYWFPKTPPNLTITTAGTDVIIDWDPPSPDFVLQRADSLDQGLWTNAPEGNEPPVVISMPDAAGFFRLALP